MLRAIFSRNLSALWIANLLLLAAYTAHGVLAPLWIQELGFREGVNGFILGLTSLGLLAGLLTLGPRIDAGDPRRYMAAGCLAWALTSALIYFFPYVPVMGFCRFIQGGGYAAFYTASLVYATRAVPQQWRGAVIGMVEAVGALTIALTPFGAIGLKGQVGYALSLLAAGLLALLAGGIVISLGKSYSSMEEKVAHIPSRLYNLQAVVPGIIGAALFLVAVAYVNLSPLIAGQLNINNIGLYLFLRALATVPTRLLSGVIADKTSSPYAIIPGYMLALLAMAGLPVLLAPGWNLLIPVIFGLGMGLASPALVHWMLQGVAERNHATAVNTYTLFTEGSGFLGSWLLGVSLQTGSLSAFWMLAGLIGLGLMAFMGMQIKQRKLIFLARKPL